MTTYKISTPGPTPWTPGVDTILYYDFEHTSGTTETNLAVTGSSYDGIYSGTPTIGTLSSGKKYFNTGGTVYSATSQGFGIVDYNNCTVCTWLSPTPGAGAYFGQSWWSTPGGGTSSGLGTIFCERLSNNNYQMELGQTYGKNVGSSAISGWSCVVMTGNNGTITIYVNGTQEAQETNQYLGNTNNTKFCIGGAYQYGNSSPRQGNLSIGSMIIEDKIWTLQEIQDYYNSTCADYGLTPIS